MGTEADKTNTAVIGTLFAIGAAAMIAGSAALVALARGEMDVANQELGGYADLSTVRDLKAKQRARLQQAKLPLAKAEGLVLKEIQANPSAASPAVEADPESTPSAELDAGAGDAGDAEQPDDGEEDSTNDQGSTESADEPADPQAVPKANPGTPTKAPEPTPTAETPPKSSGGTAPAPQPQAPAPTVAPKPTAPKAPPAPAPVPGQ